MTKTSFAYSSSDEGEERSLKRRKTTGRKKWSVNELEILAEAFGGLGKPPGNEDVMQFQQHHSVFHQRTIPQIKSRAWHFISTGS